MAGDCVVGRKSPQLAPLRYGQLKERSSWGIFVLNLLFSALVLNAFRNNVLQREEKLPKFTK